MERWLCLCLHNPQENTTVCECKKLHFSFSESGWEGQTWTKQTWRGGILLAMWRSAGQRGWILIINFLQQIHSVGMKMKTCSSLLENKQGDCLWFKQCQCQSWRKSDHVFTSYSLQVQGFQCRNALLPSSDDTMSVKEKFHQGLHKEGVKIPQQWKGL